MTIELFSIIMVIIEMLFVVMLIILALKGKKKHMWLYKHIVFLMLVILLIYLIATNGKIQSYDSGFEYTNIEKITKSDDKYTILLDNGNKYKISNAIYGYETKLIIDCNIVKKSILGIDIKENSNIIVIRPNGLDNMSESEKQYYFNL